MALNLTSVQQEGVMSGIKVLVYGEAGIGKTVLCTTCEDPIIISSEMGLLSAAKIIKEQGLPDIPVIRIKDTQDLKDAYNYCATGEGRKYKTICIDSLTEIMEQLLSKAKKEFKDGRMAYVDMMDKATDIVKQFRDLVGRDIYFSCKQGVNGGKVFNGSKFSPDAPGASLQNNLPYLVDEVFHLELGVNPETGETFRFLRTQPDVMYHAKDRSGCLSTYEPANLGYVINKIKAHVA